MFWNRRLLVACSALLAGLLPLFSLNGPASGAGTLPGGFVQSRVVEDLTDPTTMRSRPTVAYS